MSLAWSCVVVGITLMRSFYYACGFRTRLANEALSSNTSFSWQQPQILSATYGYKGCIGVSLHDIRSKTKLRSLGCTVVENSDGTWETNAVTQLQASLLCGRHAPMYMDGLPVTFNYPMLSKGVDRTAFLITLSDGSQILPFCLNMAPANEMNEMMTPLLLVDGVSSKGLHIVHFEVIGDVRLLRPDGEVLSARGLAYNGPKLRYQDTGPSLVWASLSVFSAAREAQRSMRRSSTYPNHCRVAFSATTHVLKLAMDGGSTKDGITQLRREDFNYFEIKLPDGRPFPTTGTLLGLADLGWTSEPGDGDGDNFFDLCLALEYEDIIELRKQENTLIAAAKCTVDTKLYYPKGDCAGSCGDVGCRRSEIRFQVGKGPLDNVDFALGWPDQFEMQTKSEALWLEQFEKLDSEASGIVWSSPGDEFVDFEGGKVIYVNGQAHKCCCSSNILSKPDESFKVTVVDQDGPNFQNASHRLQSLSHSRAWNMIAWDIDAGHWPAFNLYNEAVLIVADVIEHLRSPQILINVIHGLLQSGMVRAVVLSTPIRDATYDLRYHNGPPHNPAHVREWTTSEFFLFLRCQELPVAALFHVEFTQVALIGAPIDMVPLIKAKAWISSAANDFMPAENERFSDKLFKDSGGFFKEYHWDRLA